MIKLSCITGQRQVKMWCLQYRFNLLRRLLVRTIRHLRLCCRQLIFTQVRYSNGFLTLGIINMHICSSIEIFIAFDSYNVCLLFLCKNFIWCYQIHVTQLVNSQVMLQFFYREINNLLDLLIFILLDCECDFI